MSIRMGRRDAVWGASLAVRNSAGVKISSPSKSYQHRFGRQPEFLDCQVTALVAVDGPPHRIGGQCGAVDRCDPNLTCDIRDRPRVKNAANSVSVHFFVHVGIVQAPQLLALLCGWHEVAQPSPTPPKACRAAHTNRSVVRNRARALWRTHLPWLEIPAPSLDHRRLCQV